MSPDATGVRRNATRGPCGRVGCSQVHRGSDKHDTGLRRTGRLAKVAGKTGGVGHASRPSELAPIGAGCSQADCHSHADSTPCRVCPSPYGRLLAPNSASFTYVDFYVGGRLAMCGTASGQGAPLVEREFIKLSDPIYAPETATGSRSRARASLAVLRSVWLIGVEVTWVPRGLLGGRLPWSLGVRRLPPVPCARRASQPCCTRRLAVVARG